MPPGLRRLAIPGGLAALTLIAWLLDDFVSSLLPADKAAVGRQIVEALLAMSCAWFAMVLLDVVVWQRIPEERRPPRLLTDLFAGFVIISTALIVASVVFALPVTSIVTTSGIAIAVLGFALRDILASVFAGIALNFERPYHIGDWLLLPSGTVAQVREVSWLTTRLVSRDNVSIVMPNARLSVHGFENYGRRGQRFRDSFTVILDHELPPDRVERILKAAEADVPEIAQMKPAPDIVIEAFVENGVRWRVRYWLADYKTVVEIRSKLHRAILRHLQQAGISLPYGKLDMFHAPMPPRALTFESDRDKLLARCEVFESLSTEDLRSLAARARRRRLQAGDTVVRQGEEGDSIFIVVEGLLRVTIATRDGEREVNILRPGASFGEFALLMDEPRTATVRAMSDTVLLEVVREDLAPILQERPELAEKLSRMLAERRQTTAEVLKRDQPDMRRVVATRSEHALLDRIRALFGLTSDNGSGSSPDTHDKQEEKVR